jgi:hypothetical protein
LTVLKSLTAATCSFGRFDRQYLPDPVIQKLAESQAEAQRVDFERHQRMRDLPL